MRRLGRGGAGVVLAAAALAACGPGSGPSPSPPRGPTPAAARPEPTPSVAEPAPWFEEVADSVGLRFTYVSGHRERFLMPEIMGGGVALVDVDGDGDLDVYLVQGGRVTGPREENPPNRLFLNRGDGTFEDGTEGSGADDRGYGMGVTAGDFDADGDVDLHVTNLGPNVLLRNDGEGRFTDVTEAAGVGHAGWGSSSAFFDFDRDGDLDLFVLNYLDWSAAAERECFAASGPGLPDYCSPIGYDAPARDVLYRNEGDGTFTDVTEPAGLAEVFGTGLGIACTDFDGDGWPDVFVANDGMMDELLVNRRDGTFVDRALVAGCAVDEHGLFKAGMGVDAADLDDDGDPEILVVNLARQTDSLFRNDGRTFLDVTAAWGIGATSRPFTRFGTAFVDFDQDGWLDLYQANGRVERQGESYSADPYAEPNLVFRGGVGPRFSELLPRGGTARPVVGSSRGAAVGDLDGDGGVDVVVVERDAPTRVLRNVVPERGRSVVLDVRDARGAPGLGARVTLTVGGRRLTRDVRVAHSYQSSSDHRLHVGLGAESVARDVRVLWPNGDVQPLGDLDAGRVVTVRPGG